MSSSPTTNKLIDLALEALQFSHSPYSKKKIGASLLLSNGKIYSGCNIENASYGGTVCAERVALFKAFSENKKPITVDQIVVASLENEPWPPCGFCRQVLAEFGTPETIVILVNSTKNYKEYIFKDIFPLAFKPEHLE
jgi:cytidine deaminase